MKVLLDQMVSSSSVVRHNAKTRPVLWVAGWSTSRGPSCLTAVATELSAPHSLNGLPGSRHGRSPTRALNPPLYLEAIAVQVPGQLTPISRSIGLPEATVCVRGRHFCLQRIALGANSPGLGQGIPESLMPPRGGARKNACSRVEIGNRRLTWDLATGLAGSSGFPTMSLRGHWHRIAIDGLGGPS